VSTLPSDPLTGTTDSSTASASNIYAGRVGTVVSNDLDDAPLPVIQSEFAQLSAGGISWVREDFDWGTIEPQPGVFNWKPLDNLMTAAANHGIQVLGILDYSAPWASSDPTGQGSKVYPPSNNQDFASYAAAVTVRYGLDGAFWRDHPGLPVDPVSALEVWNEPFGDWFWQPGPDPAAYAALVEATAPAIHSVDPSMTVLMSGDLDSWDDRNEATGTQSQPWLATLLQDAPDLAHLVNGLDVHPYPTPRSSGPYDSSDPEADTFGRVILIHDTEVAAGVDLPIWITEIGWSTAPDTTGAVSEETQAQYDTEAVQRSIGDWGSFVAKVFVFGWFRSDGVVGDADGGDGLIEPDGTLSPAWQSLTALLGGTSGASDPTMSTTS
jgi:hypothetical protein